jgi:lipopolysaccharide export system permease protein
MLFHSSIRRELARSFGAVLVILITIVMTILLVRTLGLATRGAVNPSDVMLVLGYTVLGHLPTILSLSLFIAVVSTLSRMYRDSEMVIWFSSGRGLMGFINPLLRFAWPVLLAIAALSLLVWPWSNSQIQDLKDRFEQRSDIDRVEAGQFQESAGGRRVFFLYKNTSAEGRSAKNVFIVANENDKEAVTSARDGKITQINGDKFLELSQGQRTERALTESQQTRISSFETYAVRVGTKGNGGSNASNAFKTENSLSLALSRVPAARGELAWRLGIAVAAINFALLALAATQVNARAARAGSLMFALLAFVVYYNLINLGKSWVSSQRISFESYLLILHGTVLLINLLWILKRHNQWHLRDLLPHLPKRRAMSTHA